MKLSSIVWFLFSFCLTTKATSATSSTVKSGNYSVLGCGARTDGVGALVQQLRNGLEVAHQSPSTSIVYNKFFKGVDPTVVKGVLSGLAIRLNIPNQGQPWRPKIFCANLNMPRLAPHGEICQDRSVYATASRRYQYVFLCQKIFSLKGRPDATDCAGTLAHGLEPTGQSLARTQMTILLHELVDIYLASRPGMRPLRPKVFGLNAVIDLPASKSVINPANYVFYVANIMAHCTRF